VDTAFMVCNEKNYPNLMRLFRELGVTTQPSEMSMGLSCAGCGLAYLCGSPLRGLPVRPAGVSGSAWDRATAEAADFNENARTLLNEAGSRTTVGDLIETRSYSDFFAEHMLLALVSSVWSCDPVTARQYPARYLCQFLSHHGLLEEGAALRWRIVVGGSRTYVERVARRLADVRRSTPVRSVRRTGAGGVEIRGESGSVDRFAVAVVATHPGQALKFLTDATPLERKVLGAIPYLRNEAVLHTDAALLPADRRLWASWNQRRSSCRGRFEPVRISYYLNRLQCIDDPVDYIVTLNPGGGVRPDAVLARMSYEHPVYTLESDAARRRLPQISGDNFAFAGAYHGWGFHEDGCLSGIRAASALGVTW
jgi:uncharacterized protein